MAFSAALKRRSAVSSFQSELQSVRFLDDFACKRWHIRLAAKATMITDELIGQSTTQLCVGYRYLAFHQEELSLKRLDAELEANEPCYLQELSLCSA